MSETVNPLLAVSNIRDVLDALIDGVYILDRRRCIVYWNPSAERLTGFSAEEVQGRRCSDNILMHVTKQGKSLCRRGCPMTATLLDQTSREAEVFLHHKKGHRVPVLVRTAPLMSASGEVVGVIEIFSDDTRRSEMERENEHLKGLALVDELTQVGNRRYAELRLREVLSESSRYSWPFGCLFIDIDHFKSVNDTWGHDVGDKTLQMVAHTLSGSLRASDLVCRWGGEEFICVVRQVTAEQLRAVGEKARALVETSRVPLGRRKLRVTVSIGGSVGRPDDTPETVIKRADQAMYFSKQTGRNRVTIE